MCFIHFGVSGVGRVPADLALNPQTIQIMLFMLCEPQNEMIKLQCHKDSRAVSIDSGLWQIFWTKRDVSWWHHYSTENNIHSQQ